MSIKDRHLTGHAQVQDEGVTIESNDEELSPPINTLNRLSRQRLFEGAQRQLQHPSGSSLHSYHSFLEDFLCEPTSDDLYFGELRHGFYDARSSSSSSFPFDHPRSANPSSINPSMRLRTVLM